MSEPEGPLIVQGDFTLLLEVGTPGYEAARDEISRFAEIVKAPEYMHTYKLSPLSVWNAAASGLSAAAMIASLERYSRYPLPPQVRTELLELAARYGKLELHGHGDSLRLLILDPVLAEELPRHKALSGVLGTLIKRGEYELSRAARGRLKQALIKVGYPVADLAGYTPGEPLEVTLRDTCASGIPFKLRGYQREAVDLFHGAGAVRGGSGVVVLPCGAGKTVVGIAAMAKIGASTLILATGITAARQWIRELLDKSFLKPEQVGEYSGDTKTIRPVTVATYQILTHRADEHSPFTHFELFEKRDWGLIVYDEVHMLPAPIFQLTAGIQARRRLGLTATLVREDGRQDDVFALIGPKKYDVPWKVMEREGWIARAECIELRVPISDGLRAAYLGAPERTRLQVAAANPNKEPVIEDILARHKGLPALIIGTFLEHLKVIAQRLNAPLITGQTSGRKREELFGGFRSGNIPVLVVSKVANFAVDLPDAALAVQVSGSFGSRQEEAQRLGRLLRPKEGENRAYFYSLVSRDTCEQDFAHHRQLFLTEQGYTYSIGDV